jgi:hypothetical protein
MKVDWRMNYVIAFVLWVLCATGVLAEESQEPLSPVAPKQQIFTGRSVLATSEGYLDRALALEARYINVAIKDSSCGFPITVSFGVRHKNGKVETIRLFVPK